MEKSKPNFSSEDSSDNEKTGSNREGSDRTANSNYKKFAKDKRKRIVRVEKNPRSTDTPGLYWDENEKERRSYNPNFTRDNVKREGSRDRKTGYGQRDNTREGNYQQNRPRQYDNNRESYSNESGSRDNRNYRPNQNSRNYGQQNGDRYSDNRDSRNKPYRDNRGAGSQGGYKSGSRDGYGNKQGFNRGNKNTQNRKRNNAPVYDKENYPRFARPKQTGEIRLNRFLSMSGVSSRREADDLITAGLVTVNGVIVTELGSKVQPDDVVKFNDAVLKGESKVYILMNKPKGYVTTIEDPHADKTVMDLLKNNVNERVYPVGRLDKNTLGVLLITNDGDMTKKLTHPTYNKKKIYHVTLDKALTKADMEQVATGITLEDGEIHADEINYVGDSKKEVGIEIHSGRNRIIRRIFEHLGYRVVKLDRVYFAGLTKKNLKRGAWRFLNPREVNMLHSGLYE